MPPKKKDSKMTSAELRKLIRAHNKLSNITIPKGSTRDEIIIIIEKNGYTVDHKNKAIKPKVKRGKQVSLKEADKMYPKKTEAQKKEAKDKREAKKKEAKDREGKLIKAGATMQKALAKKKEAKKKLIPKDKTLSNIKDKKKKMPTISTQTETPKKKQVLKLPSQKPKKITIDKSKKPPMNTKKIEPKKKEEKVEKKSDLELVKRFKIDFLQKMRGASGAGGTGLTFRTNKPLTKIRQKNINKLITAGRKSGDSTDVGKGSIFELFNIKYQGDSDFGFIRLVLEYLDGKVPEWFVKMSSVDKKRIKDLFEISLSPNAEGYADGFASKGQPANDEALKRFKLLNVLSKKEQPKKKEEKVQKKVDKKLTDEELQKWIDGMNEEDTQNPNIIQLFEEEYSNRNGEDYSSDKKFKRIKRNLRSLTPAKIRKLFQTPKSQIMIDTKEYFKYLLEGIRTYGDDYPAEIRGLSDLIEKKIKK